MHLCDKDHKTRLLQEIKYFNKFAKSRGVREMSNARLKPDPQILSGAAILIWCLLEENVDTVFGYPGGANLPIYDSLYCCKEIRHILTRHEQAAIHAADGYARVTGKPGVALVTSGPGATNAVTGIANAYMDSIPLIVFTGQVPTEMIGRDSFQEVDIYGITMAITKHNYMVFEAEDLPRIIKKAFYLANTGRPGPVLIDLPKNVMNAKTEWNYPDRINIRGYNLKPAVPERVIQRIGQEIQKASKPVLLVGGGVISSSASEVVRELAIFRM